MTDSSSAHTQTLFHRFLAGLLLFIAAFGVYGNAIKNPFIIDDGLAIEHHPDVLHADGLFTLWTHDYWAGLGADPNLYRPITILSFSLNRLFTGMDPAGFRVVNIALLALLAWLLGRWLSRYVHPAAAWGAAFLFVIHPSNTEVINHVVGRADLLALIGVFVFLIGQQIGQPIIQHGLSANASTKTNGKTSSTGSLLLMATGVILALGSKESGWVVIPLAFVNAWLLAAPTNSTEASLPVSPRVLPRETPTESSPDTSSQNPTSQISFQLSLQADRIIRPALLILIPFSVLYFLGRLKAVGVGYHLPPNSLDDLTGNPLRGVNLSHRLPGSLSILADYARDVFRPATSFNHIPTDLPTWSSPSVWIGVALLLIAVIALIRSLFSITRRWMAIPLFLALFQYLLVGNLLAPTGVYVANRLSLPFTICILSLLACLAGKWLSIKPNILKPTADGAPAKPSLSFSQRLLLCALPFVFIAPLLIAMTIRANAKWSSEYARMSADVALQPTNPVAMYHMGIALSDTGQNAEGAEWLRDVVKKRPDSLQGRFNLGGVEYLLHHFPAAREQYAVVISNASEPSMLGKANTAMGVMAMLDKDYISAEHYLAEAYQELPRDPDVLFNRAELAKARARYPMALQRYEELFEVVPRHEAGRRAYEELKAFLLQQK